MTLNEVKQIFSDTYLVCAKYTVNRQLEAREWFDLVDEVNRVNQKHNKSLCKDILLAVLDAVEEDQKRFT